MLHLGFCCMYLILRCSLGLNGENFIDSDIQELYYIYFIIFIYIYCIIFIYLYCIILIIFILLKFVVPIMVFGSQLLCYLYHSAFIFELFSI